MSEHELSELSDDVLLAQPGVMRAVWHSRCPSCFGLIHGGQHCSCGQTHGGDIQGIAAVAGWRTWVCRDCLTGGQPM